jgi:hypothetical protein
VDDLSAFARECWPEVTELNTYRSLQLRRRIGPRVMPYLQPLILTAAVRKGREKWWWYSWRRRGI